MSSFMKKTREDLSLNTKEISSIIRIRENFLVAIENEQYDEIPLEVYARGYIKVYAKFLEVPYEQAIEPYERYLAAKTGKIGQINIHSSTQSAGGEINTETDLHTGTCGHWDDQAPQKQLSCNPYEKPLTKTWYRRPAPILASLILIMVLGVVFYQFILSDFSHKDDIKKGSAQKTQDGTPAATAEPVKQERVAPEAFKPGVAPTTSQAVVLPTLDTKQISYKGNGLPNPAGDNKVGAPKNNGENIIPRKKRHVLVISAMEQTGLQLLIDGKETIDITLEPGESRTFNAYKSVSGIVRNSSGVRVKFDGKPLPPGKNGEAMILNLPNQ
jgi:hypothetical protein